MHQARDADHLQLVAILLAQGPGQDHRDVRNATGVFALERVHRMDSASQRLDQPDPTVFLLQIGPAGPQRRRADRAQR
jgi:hypothetical protein